MTDKQVINFLNSDPELYYVAYSKEYTQKMFSNEKFLMPDDADHGLFLLEGDHSDIEEMDETDSMAFRLFKNKEMALRYKNLLVESIDLRPSQLFIGSGNFSEIFSSKSLLHMLSMAVYSLPLRLIVTNIDDDNALQEYVVYDSGVLLN